MASTQRKKGNVVSLDEYINTHSGNTPSIWARIRDDGEIEFAMQNVSSYDARLLLIAALSMCIDLAVLAR